MANIYYIGKLFPDTGEKPTLATIDIVKKLLDEEPENFIGHSLLIEEALFEPPSGEFRGNICLCLDEISAQITHIFAYHQGECVVEHELSEPLECLSELITYIETSLSADGAKKNITIKPDVRLFYRPAIEKIQSLCQQHFQPDEAGIKELLDIIEEHPNPEIAWKKIKLEVSHGQAA